MSGVTIFCNNPNCPHFKVAKGSAGNIVKCGTTTRAHDGIVVQRYRCKTCRKYFSTQTFNSTYRQRKPRINPRIRELICASVSQRRIARILRVSKGTVAKRITWLAKQAHEAHERFLQKPSDVSLVNFDEMETFEHTKCKPLSIALAVEGHHRRILGFAVSSMPCKGPLAKTSRKKYGLRKDDRDAGLRSVLETVGRVIRPGGTIASDKCPRYPALVKELVPGASHIGYLGKRGCVVGQGELKATGNDPLFALNHTAAMIRDDIKRLSRRTWCTTKKPEYLANILSIYTHYRNENLVAL